MTKYRRFRKPHRIRRRKSIFKSRLFWGLIFLLIVLGGGFYFFIFSEFFQTKEIIITGAAKVPAETLESIAREALPKKILFFESESIFLADPEKIKEEILQKNPQVEEVEIKRKFPHSLSVAVKEREEVGIFCGQNACFLLDGEGVLFEAVGSEETGLSLPSFYNKTFNAELRLREKVFDKNLLNLILDLDEHLESNLKITLSEISLVSEERLNVKTAEGWEIYFNPKNDLNWQIASLATILEKRLPQEKRGELEYIDLRFDKIFVYPSLD